MKKARIRTAVRRRYGAIAREGGGCCGPAPCCSGPSPTEAVGRAIGYTDEEMRAVPDGSNLGLGCGNPLGLALVREGDTVLDLGSGAGLDCFLASRAVGPSGRVIGVDMTPEMVEKARANAAKGGFGNVEFRLGEIESLPVADGSVDLVISNCVVNLSADKGRAFREAFRALRPGGRLVISDIVLLRELPERIRRSVEAYVGCVAGAALREDYLEAVERAGFEEIRVLSETTFPASGEGSGAAAEAIGEALGIPPEAAAKAAGAAASVTVSAVKPVGESVPGSSALPPPGRPPRP